MPRLQRLIWTMHPTRGGGPSLDSFNSTVFYRTAVEGKRKRCLIIHHSGSSYGCRATDPALGLRCQHSNDFDAVGDFAHNELNCDYFLMYPPFYGPNVQDVKTGCAWQGASYMARLQNTHREPAVRFYVQPVIHAVAYAREELGYRRIYAQGFSRGKDIIATAAALEPRIDMTFLTPGEALTNLPCDDITAWLARMNTSNLPLPDVTKLMSLPGLHQPTLRALATLEPHRYLVELLHKTEAPSTCPGDRSEYLHANWCTGASIPSESGCARASPRLATVMLDWVSHAVNPFGLHVVKAAVASVERGGGLRDLPCNTAVDSSMGNCSVDISARREEIEKTKIRPSPPLCRTSDTALEQDCQMPNYCEYRIKLLSGHVE